MLNFCLRERCIIFVQSGYKFFQLFVACCLGWWLNFVAEKFQLRSATQEEKSWPTKASFWWLKVKSFFHALASQRSSSQNEYPYDQTMTATWTLRASWVQRRNRRRIRVYRITLGLVIGSP